MSPLDAARRLADLSVLTDKFDGCWFCDMSQRCSHDPRCEAHHNPDCPWLAMPKIVAALEAAEAMLWAVDEDEWHGDGLSRSMRKAAQDLEIAMGDETDDEALVAALKGDVVP